MDEKPSTSASSARTRSTIRSTRKRSDSSSLPLPRILKSEADHQAALAALESLMHARKGTSEGDLLELWAWLIDVYERQRFPIKPSSPIEAIRFRMEQQGLDPKDLVPIIGSRSKVSEVLSGKRSLSLRMVRLLHAKLGIPLESVIGAAA